ncbi:uncharacterized protein A4U43_C03F31160 [Asparagus officinalis]|uniref:F-box domain-containing protein n=1 Tax=Asparagus officinalis TaxID=4686 RepID=A0A5P1FEA9_ASPOF|nr:F-box/LRR-repeat protein 14 [Asparagus officinalis]ONK76695.1 uncharacterized protein A4U43_C03F31160 [Asparagus officinalis]
MENLPDSLITEILKRIDKTSDRNALSTVSRRLCSVEAEQRDFLRVGCGLHPATDALTSLCLRFQNLTRVEIVYSGWMSNMGKQLNNQGLIVLSSHCPKLVDLTLSFCSFIGDIGLGHLALCEGLASLKLNFLPGISSNGLLSVVTGCKKILSLHLNRCMKVSSVEWLEYIGNHGNLESLSIKNCRGLGQDDLVMLGPGWQKLKRLEFELDANYRYWKVYSEWAVSKWKSFGFCCENLMELILANCNLDSIRPLSHVLGMCGELQNLSLDVCIGLEDSHMMALSQKSFKLRKLSLNLSPRFMFSMEETCRLTDKGLKELARGCPMLEEFELYFTDCKFPSLNCFTQDGILKLVQGCPIRILTLNSACFFNDTGMDALCSAHFLEVLEIVKCQDVTDQGIQKVLSFPSLKRLKISKCLGVSDAGLKPLVGTGKLESLIVEDCLLISENGVQNAARYVSYRQDLSWMY